MVKRFKKYQSGEGARYITRKGALKKLQLSLRDFRTVCIMKGIYPREPKHRRRAQRGKTGIQTLYLKKDIQFLMHEPIIWKLRELKVHIKRIRRAKSMKEYSMVKRYGNTIPIINVDHIIKERYPTFVDALRDLDDCLTLCFLFATMPKMKLVPPHLMALCKRLTIEFMHAVIVARALRNVFISIKGIYFQVEFKGQTITWIIPHNFSYDPNHTKEVDFQTMATFVEFYTTMLGFVNFRLYHNLSICYPPKLQGYSTEELETELIDDMVSLSDRVGALNIPLQRIGILDDDNEDEEMDQFPTVGEDVEAIDKAREEFEKEKNLKKLFEGLRFFLNREVPREPLVFILRCFGAEVSWDRTLFPSGCLYNEDDETITHQIVDRPHLEKQYISRYYIQPQWVFDSVNARKLLPVEKYFIGVTLPPHLSPFSQEYRTQRYIPPEERALKDPSIVLKKQDVNEEDLSDDEELVHSVEDMLRQEREDDDESPDDDDNDNDEDDEVNDIDGYDSDEDEEMRKKKIARLQVKQVEIKPGETVTVNKNRERKDHHQFFLMREKMIRKKYRNLYKSMKQSKISRQKEIKLLKYKRRLNERNELDQKKAELRAKRASAAML